MAVFDKQKLFDAEKVTKSLDSIVWGTPPEIFNPINDEFKFTLDVCAIAENSKCDRFFTPDDDGLKQSWENEVCWCNPPYGKDVPKWCKKALQESYRGATTVLLIPCKTNTNWWHDIVIANAEVRFLRGRVKFIQNGQQFTQALPWPLAFVVFRPRVGFNKNFSQLNLL